MGQQLLLLGAILGAFALGGVTTWFVARYQIEAYRKQSAAILKARDQILDYASTLSKLIPATKTERARQQDVLNLHDVVGSIKDHLQDIQNRVNRLELRQARERESFKRTVEPAKFSDQESYNQTRRSNEPKRDDAARPDLQGAPAATPRAPATLGQPKPPADLLQRLADIICPPKDRDSIVSFQANALALRDPPPAILPAPAPPAVPAWERLT
jgi:hypothetical protein